MKETLFSLKIEFIAKRNARLRLSRKLLLLAKAYNCISHRKITNDNKLLDTAK